MISQHPAIAYGGPLDQDVRALTTLPEALAHAAYQGGTKGITYLRPDGSELSYTYATLCEEAEHLLAGLRALGLRSGDKVILQVEENQQYLPAFWACVLGGLIAVPISIAPTYAQPGVVTAKLQKAWELCQRPLILASARLAPALRTLAPALGMRSAHIETVETLRAYPATAETCRWHPSQPDDLFLILFTSGSTGIPKGVMLTHRNVLSLAHGYAQLEGLTRQEVTFNWMPLDHVGGLITFHLRDVYLGCRQIHASPQTVLQDPLSWLDCLTRYRATCTWAPNFAFSLINEQLATGSTRAWDLSALRYILNAGEAIVPKTARRFLELLRPHGLPSTAIHPSWGMSETSSGVTFSSSFALETTSDEDRFVDVGALIPQVWVRVVDMQDHVLEQGQSGRIQVKGPTVTLGYYRNPELNREAFTVDDWFDTGDVGILREGRLTITGRTKNIIIINGLNYYCHEIEAVVEEVAGVEVTWTAACAVRSSTDDTDGLAIFYCSQFTQEEALAEQCREIRQRVVSAVGINPGYLLPLDKDAIPKTETGKIQRNKLKQQFEEGAFDAIQAKIDLLLRETQDVQTHEIAGESEQERQLILIWQQVLKRTGIHSTSNFFELGGDSLTLMRLLARAQAAFHVTLSPRSAFDFPTVATLAQHIEACQQQALKQIMPADLPPARATSPSLSFTQQRMWFLEQLHPGSAAYAVCGVFSLRGHLDVIALGRSLQEIVRRHETLRTTFHERDGRPVLSIASGQQIVLPVISLQNLSPAEQMLAVPQRILQEVQQPFDLAQGPLARFTLLHLQNEEHIFIVAFHHIIVDGWSMEIFYRELAALYDAFGQGAASPLPELPMQFVDFAAWERQRLRGEVLERELSWWRQRLRGAPALLALPTDHPRPPVQTDQGAHATALLAPSLLQQLKELSQQEHVTLFMTLFAAFNVLLYRYSGQEDLVVGTFAANRNSQTIEPLIGFFASTLPLRTDLSEPLQFRALLRQVREATLDAYAHQDIPFDLLVDALQIERDLTYSPLIQVLFVLQNQPMFVLELKGLSSSFLPFDNGRARFDLVFEAVETDAGLHCVVEYSTDLFDTVTIARMLSHWQVLLTAIVRHPEQLITDLPLLSAAEQKQPLDILNATAVEFPALCMHQLFERQAASTPDATALSYDRERLTYRELEQQANQLAHYLHMLGVGPDVLVGIYVERSPEMLVGLLGVLKAGGAYVPLDPMYPKERLEFMIADAHLSVLLTQQRLLNDLPQHQALVICLDTERVRFASQSTTPPAVVLDAEHLAYVIYTSGSTGKPKGVQIAHGALSNFLQTMREQPGMSAQDRLLAVTTLSFDIAGLELYLPLICGAQIILVSREVAADGVQLAERIQSTTPTVMQATPATWRLLLEAGWSGSPDLKILCGGEAFPVQLVRQLLARAGALWNMYGPTETTIWSTICRMNVSDELVSIGAPIANTQVYILDRSLHPVPTGVVGELYLGGSGLARGYLNRPDLTAEKFLPNPFSREPGARMYRTGDLARSLADGRLECLGRIDNQVKLRGFRIELSEIEATLIRHPAVQECAVLVQEEATGNKRLVACLVPGDQEVPSSKALRAFLKETLPDYMLPVAFVSLDQFPRTPNGKLDRRALLALDYSQGEQEADFVSPQTPLEQVLTSIWRSILGIEHIGMHDDFFDLGGHSSLATQLIFRVNRDFRVRLPLQFLFEHPTPAEFAEALLAREEVAGTMTRIARDLQLN